MRFVKTQLSGAWLVLPEPAKDERGWFARGRCAREFSERDLPDRFVQTNFSQNRVAGTFRGLHYQVPPSAEGKLVRCIRGEIRDIIVDLRPGSGSFLRHEWFTLNDRDMAALYVPPGFGHGFITVVDDTVVMYEMSDFYQPELARGFRWDDPALDIQLPAQVRVISERDAGYPDLDAESLACFGEKLP